MASSEEMQQRAAALKKASAIKTKLGSQKFELLAKVAGNPNSAYVYLVYSNKQKKLREAFSGIFEPFQQQKFSADETLTAICHGLENRSHLSAQPEAVMGAIADYLALSPAITKGLQEGKQGVLLILATELDQTCSASVKIMVAEELYQTMTDQTTLSVADGVDIFKI